MRKTFVSAVVLAALSTLAGAPAALRAQGGKPPGKSMGLPVKAAPVKVGTVTSDVTAVGTLLANESVMIRPEVAGRVAAIHFNEGQAVAAGARLVSLDATEVQAQLAASRADERLTGQRAERAAELFKKNFISQQALEDAREAYKKASAQRQENEARAAKTEIRAPFAGTVGLRQVSAGAYLKAGEDIVRLDKIDAMKLDFRVPEVYLGKIRRDQPVAVRVDAFPGEHFSGRVYALETAVDDKTRTVQLRGRVGNKGLKLRPGMFARVTLELGSNDKAMLVPEQALVPRGDKNFVFRVVDGKASLTEVGLGSRTPGQVEIVRGLKPGELVVTDGQLKLQDGTPVMVLPDKPPAVPPPPAPKG
ncbi:MAG: efflux RND transporter periplasmic adaptor subunit [Betaproteobacteria bacterium]|nr:efflux RND transporter periplasmic adaptor subunit [Betaproteobacteria bacterium]